jgi:hypothetical protein
MISSTTGVYTPPNTVASPTNFTVIATSNFDPTKTGTATVTVQPAVGVTISPTTVTLTPIQAQQFTATVTGASNTMVTWTVNGILGGNAAVGTVSTSGFYTAPGSVPTPAIVSVVATSVADNTKSATAAATIAAPPSGVFVSVFPRNRQLPLGRTQQFTAQVFLTTNGVVTWEVNGMIGGDAPGCTVNCIGTIDVTGLYTPPTTLPANQLIMITAVSQAVPTAFDTENATISAGVVVSPASDSLHVGDTQQFSATVTGVTSQAVTWAVKGIPGGNTTVGTITPGGLYTAPATVPSLNQLAITATSTTDPMPLPGVAAMKIYPARFMTLFPTTATVLPGGTVIFQYYTNVYPPTTKKSASLLKFLVNGVPNGNAMVGTINAGGVYTAPLTPQTVTIMCQSLVNMSFSASSTVTVAAVSGPSSVTLLDAYTKIRPYDTINGQSSISLTAAHQEYADFQVLVTGRGEDLSNVDVSVSNLSDGKGNTISSSNSILYYEKYLNVFYQSRLQGSATGEWPDPLIPKVDPIVGETRNAFPFSVNRISPAYKNYPLNGSNATNVGRGAATAKSGGTFTGSVVEMFDIVIDGSGTLGTATFKWSLDGGLTFRQTGVPTSATPVTLTDGVTISFQSGNLPGVADFIVGDSFWIFGGPSRNNGVWVDYYVPMTAPAGTYTGTVTVTQTGKPAVTLPINLQVYPFAIPVSADFPLLIQSYWPAFPVVHFMNSSSGNQTTALGQRYSIACLIDRQSCGGNTTAATITYTATGTVATINFLGFDPAVGPLLDGTITPHGEQQTIFTLQFLGSSPTQQFFSTQAQLAHFVAKGWRSRVFDYTRDEPASTADFLALRTRATTIRTVDNTLRTLVTTGVFKFNFNTEGYVSRYVPNFVSIGDKDYAVGPQPDPRAFYNSLVPPDEVWWYDSCVTHGCGRPLALGPPYLDNWPNIMADTSAIMNRVWGWMSVVPYDVQGFLYGNSIAYNEFLNMTAPQIDVFESIYYFGGNGDGTLFYPGRPSQIGGVTHIPIESQRMKHLRDAEVDIEYGMLLKLQGNTALLQGSVLGVTTDIYTYDPNPASWINLRQALGQNIH